MGLPVGVADPFCETALVATLERCCEEISSVFQGEGRQARPLRLRNRRINRLRGACRELPEKADSPERLSPQERFCQYSGANAIDVNFLFEDILKDAHERGRKTPKG